MSFVFRLLFFVSLLPFSGCVVEDPPPTTDPEPTQSSSFTSSSSSEARTYIFSILGDSPGFCSIDGAAESVNAGYTGVRYLNGDNQPGTKIEWQINATKRSNHEFELRFANGSNTDRSGILTINDQPPINLDFPQTGDWTQWQTIQLTGFLVRGINSITLEGTGSDGLANIDYLEITGGEIHPTDCDPNAQPVDIFTEGQSLYNQQCAGCHGSDGKGGAVNRSLADCNLCKEPDALVRYIAEAMPPGQTQNCDQHCAESTAEYILYQFNNRDTDVYNTLTKARVWRLTIEEYKTSLRHILNLPTSFEWLEGPEDRDSLDYFHTHSDFLQTDIQAARYFSNQSENAIWSISDNRFADLIPCDISDRSCSQTFAQEFAANAFRRPVDDQESSIYETMSQGAEGIERFRRIAYGILNSPYFIYRTEIGDLENENKGIVAMTNHEIASMLSYSLIGAPPSESTLAFSNTTDLNDPRNFEALANELLQLPEANERLHRFIMGWLLLDNANWNEISRDTEVCQSFDNNKNALAREFKSFLNINATLNNGLTELLTGMVPTPSGTLAEFYRSAGLSENNQPNRMGALTSGMFTAAHARFVRPSPVLRGVFIRERLLCQDFVAPPDVPPLEEPRPGDPVITNRDLYEEHVANPVCSTCHQYFDPLGFTMENFDACGRYRQLDNGVQVDASGEILGTDFDTPVDNIFQLSEILANQNQVQKCFTEHAFQFYRGMPLSPGFYEEIESITQEVGSNGTYKQIILKLLENPEITLRKR